MLEGESEILLPNDILSDRQHAFISNQALHPAPSKKNQQHMIWKTVVRGNTSSHSHVTLSHTLPHIT